MSAWVLLGLGVTGAVISIHFILAYYGQVESKEVPAALCRREEGACTTVLHTPYARMFGVPNAVLGLVFYGLTLGVAALMAVSALPRWLWQVNLAASAVSVLLAPYLVWALVARLKTWCRL